ncbi:unnamed protein product [Cunninghamella echinulata]
MSSTLKPVEQPLTPEQIMLKNPVRSMNEERAKAKFNVRELTYLLNGDQNLLK